MSPLVMIYSPYFVYCTMANMVDVNSMHTFHTINEPVVHRCTCHHLLPTMVYCAMCILGLFVRRNT